MLLGAPIPRPSSLTLSSSVPGSSLRMHLEHACAARDSLVRVQHDVRAGLRDDELDIVDQGRGQPAALAVICHRPPRHWYLIGLCRKANR